MLLPVEEFAINSHVQSALQHLPFEVMYGYQLDFTIPAGGCSNISAVDKCFDQLKEARMDTKAALQRSKEEIAEDGKLPREFKIGDKVWLNADKVQVHQASRKLGPRQLSPYEITEKLGNRDYWLKLPAALKIHDVFHIDRLALWRRSKVNGELLSPPTLVEIDHEEEFEVEDIIDSHLFCRQLQYLF